MKKIVIIVVRLGPLQGHKYIVKTDSPVLIGRSEEANIYIAYDKLCSRRHAIVFWEKKSCYIRDLDSTNGTYLNGERFQGQKELNNNDIIKLGRTEFIINILDVPEDQKYLPDDDIVYED